jgi:DNA-binding NarL/FixJ family response regulator
VPAETRVLIVDDNEDLVALFIAYLSDDPRFDIVGDARTGREALALAESLKPDAVLLDDSMPGGSGIEILADLRALLPDARIVLHTADARGESLALGADVEVQKAIAGLDDVADALARPGSPA